MRLPFRASLRNCLHIIVIVGRGKEKTMAQLIVAGFKKDMYRASDVLNRLQRMDEKPTSRPLTRLPSSRCDK